MPLVVLQKKPFYLYYLAGACSSAFIQSSEFRQGNLGVFHSQQRLLRSLSTPFFFLFDVLCLVPVPFLVQWATLLIWQYGLFPGVLVWSDCCDGTSQPSSHQSRRNLPPYALVCMTDDRGLSGYTTFNLGVLFTLWDDLKNSCVLQTRGWPFC